VKPTNRLLPIVRVLALCAFLCFPALLHGQGVTTAAMSGVVADQNGSPLADANVVAVHVPSGTQYRAVTRAGGAYNVPNMRVGGPYRVTATRIGYRSHTEADVFLSLGQDLSVDFRLEAQAVELEPVVATAGRDEVLNPGRTGAATFIDPNKVELLPSIKRSTRDLFGRIPETTAITPSRGETGCTTTFRWMGPTSTTRSAWTTPRPAARPTLSRCPTTQSSRCRFRSPRSTCVKEGSRVPTSTR